MSAAYLKAPPAAQLIKDRHFFCSGKVRFASPAMAIMVNMQRLQKRQIYRCTACGGWHLGTPRRDNIPVSKAAYARLVRRVTGRVLILLSLLSFPARAHDMDDPNGAWFQSLKVPGDPMMPLTGTSCCNGGRARDADCQNVEVRIRNGQWEAFIDSKTFPDTDYSPIYGHAPNDWVPVPEGAIIRGRDNPTGRPVACWFNRTIRCFIEGTES